MSVGKANDQATSLNEGVKSGRMSKVPPCLSFGADDRNLGVVTKAEQPPVARSEHKMDMGADSISTEKGKPTQQLKTEQIPDPWGANEWGRNDWRGSMGFNWRDPIGWGAIPTNVPAKRQLRKRGEAIANLVEPNGRSWRQCLCRYRMRCKN